MMNSRCEPQRFDFQPQGCFEGTLWKSGELFGKTRSTLTNDYDDYVGHHTTSPTFLPGQTSPTFLPNKYQQCLVQMLGWFGHPCWALLGDVGQSVTSVKNVGCCWMLFGNVGMVWSPYPIKSCSLKHNGKSPSSFEFTFLGRGKLRVRLAKGQNQILNETIAMLLNSPLSFLLFVYFMALPHLYCVK